MLGFLLLYRVAHKLVYYVVAAGPFALVFFLCRGFFAGWPDALTIMAAFLASLVMSFLLGFFLEATLGMIGFWFLEVSSLLFVYMLFNFFFSGHMFPIDMLPRRLGARWCELIPLAIPGLLSGGRVPGQDRRAGAVAGALRASSPGSCSSSCSAAHRRSTAAVRGYSGYRRRNDDDDGLPSTPFTVIAIDDASRPSYLRVFLTFARNSLVRDMTFRANFLIDARLVAVLDGDEPGLLPADLPVHAARSARTPAGGSIEFFVFLATTLVHQQPGAGLLHDQRRRVQRADPHRHARFRPAEADRHAVP